MNFPIVETDCTITGPQGQTFTANGAMFDLERGGCLYVSDYDDNDQADWRDPANGPLTDWNGNRIGTWWRTNRYRNNIGARIDCIAATIQGREYYGRYGSDWSQLVNLRPRKTA